MAAVELDPVFVKALKLLHSKAKDSGAQLKAMLDDAIAQRKGLKVPAHSSDGGKASPGRSKSDEDSKKREAEKRSADKSTKDSSESDSKKLKIDSKSRSKEEKDARDKEKERAKREKEERDAHKQREKAEKERKEKELASKQEAEVTMVSDDEEPAARMDAGDFALEMGIACVVCRQFDVSSGNQLVECQECHSLYHQV
ncbi:unnamed protein product [Lymnaea stagnalis]|uniref:Uncharacterized protein n=1 Tax=Lymnaea stagnalis TaxID=6523 RepID=A0AAV2HFB1_LYMST